jgi:hypothetical protein
MASERWRVGHLQESIWLTRRSRWDNAPDRPGPTQRLGAEAAAAQIDTWFPDGWGGGDDTATLASIAASLGEQQVWDHDGETRRWLKSVVKKALRDGRLSADRAGPMGPAGGGGNGQADPPKPPTQQPARQPWSLMSLAYVAQIAPDKEASKPKIKWTLKDPSVSITQGKIELFRTRDPIDPAPVWTQVLSPDQLREGDHELLWDGAIGAHSDFPDGFVSVEFSPYKIKLTITDGGAPQVKEASFEVVVVDIEIVLGDKAVLSNQKDKDLYDKLGSLPAAGATSKVYLVSNLYKTTSAEMASGSGASFTEYETLWGAGARFPIDGKVWFKDSQGKKVLAPKAWGKRKLLWDWECVKPSRAHLHAKAKKFCKGAQRYSKDVTSPKGENCHKDRGGKRSSDGNPSIFSNDSGGAFPFTVTPATTRKQSSFSDPVKGGAKDGLTGVVFRPARQAGDGYKITAYFDPKKDLDKTDAIAASFKKETGTFEVWREIHLSKYIKKKATITGFTVATLQDYYKKAFIQVEDKAGGATTMAKVDYDTAFNAAIALQPANCRTHAVDSTVSQYDSGDWAVTFRIFADFKTSKINAEKIALQAATPALIDPQLTIQATQTVTTQLIAVNLDTVSKYADKCGDWALDICQKACAVFMGANDGVTIIQFKETNSNTGAATSLVNGYAPNFSSSSRSKVAFIQYADSARYVADSNTMEQTIAHEVGHHMFLPHAPLPATSLPGSADANAHDKDDLNCLMGYDYTAERKFCGLCLLRMRGWDHRKLDKDSSKNKAP